MRSDSAARFCEKHEWETNQIYKKMFNYLAKYNFLRTQMFLCFH